jgi:hypothetical protein
LGGNSVHHRRKHAGAIRFAIAPYAPYVRFIRSKVMKL